MSRGATYQSGRLMPILRWAGGKRWLVPHLIDMIGATPFKDYHEPFLGAGSVFFGIDPKSNSFLADLNADLIDAFKGVRDDPDAVADCLQLHKNDEDYYYHIRAWQPTDTSERAARFIYLNHTSFNGIYRVNRAGVYNVPYGRRDRVTIPDRAWLRSISTRLRNASLSTADFETCLDNVSKRDLVFLDPPYTVAHNKNGFVKYNQRLFSFEDQVRLSKLVDAIKEREAFYILTNAAHESIAELFGNGDRLLATSRRNNVGGLSAARGSATEYLFTNLPSHE